MNKTLIIPVIACFLFMAPACQKGFLDVKPQKSLLVPQTADDMRALLDNNNIFNNSPGLTCIADGDTYTTDAGYNAYFIDEERKSYIWAADIFGTDVGAEWQLPYQQIFYANVVLEGLEKLRSSGALSQDLDQLKGTALFHRAFAYYNLVQEFAPAYHKASSGTDPGVPLKLNSDVSEKVSRATLEASYQQILTDLKTARSLLPPTTSLKTRPALPAAYALIAKTYLAMEDYAQAGKYADSCLRLNGSLINYNTLSTTAARPFVKALPNSNDEILFYSLALTYSFQSSTSPTVADPALYASYTTNDLRKGIFFKALSPGFKFKGNYAGIISSFAGMATDELYLTRAECSARNGDAVSAVKDLNQLLATRWKTGTYVPYAATTADAALALVLTERRKELTQRGTRWGDLKRLNSDSRFAVTLNRTILGSNYTLAPDSKRYVYPIPADEIRLNGLVQNER